MFLAIMFGALVSLLGHGTYSYEECQELDFKPKACLPSKVLH